MIILVLIKHSLTNIRERKRRMKDALDEDQASKDDERKIIFNSNNDYLNGRESRNEKYQLPLDYDQLPDIEPLDDYCMRIKKHRLYNRLYNDLNEHLIMVDDPSDKEKITDMIEDIKQRHKEECYE